MVQATEDNSYNNIKSRRIASNTIVLFVRIFVITIINLYTVRLVLNGLGEIDYGIFNAVAGVVLTSTCLSSVLAISTQRFYSFAMGKNDFEKLQDIYSASLTLVVVLSLAIIILFSILGPYFINTYLTIPIERLSAAHWILYSSMFSFVFSILQIPFLGAIFAHENMGIYALISTIECSLKLIVAFMIGKTSGDNLIFYGYGLTLVAFIVFASYATTAIYRYSECRFKLLKETKIYRQLLSFSGWTFYGAISGVAMIQGSTILLNIFFGPIVNAAFAVANQVYNAMNSLSNSIVVAFRPAMIKAYASGQRDYLDKLFYSSNKFILYLLAAVTIPFVYEARIILAFWLGNVSEETILFTRLFVIFTVCMTLHNPITTIIQASGRVKKYYLYVETLTIMCIPLSYLFFKFEMNSYYIFVSMISICIVSHVVRLLFLKESFPEFTIGKYIKALIVPCAIVVCITYIITGLIHYNVQNDLLRFFIVIIASPIVTLVSTYAIGLSKEEKAESYRIIKQIIRK